MAPTAEQWRQTAELLNPGVTAVLAEEDGETVIRMTWPSGEVWVCSGQTGRRLRVEGADQ